MSRGGRPSARTASAKLASTALAAVEAVGVAARDYGVTCSRDASLIEVTQAHDAVVAAIAEWDAADRKYKASQPIASPTLDEYRAAVDSTGFDIGMAQNQRTLWNTRQRSVGG